MSGTRLALAAVLLSSAILAAVSVQPVLAFDADTHYYLTYYIAYSAGFSPEEARVIASADYAVDSAGTTSGFFYLINNPNWHGLTTHTINDRRESYLWQRALGALNSPQWSGNADERLIPFGQFLHFIQDRYSHEDHFLAEVWGTISVGHKSDWLSYIRATSELMINKTDSYVREFFARYKEISVNNTVNWEGYSPLLTDMIAANPNPQFWTGSDTSAGHAAVERKMGSAIPAPIEFTYDSLGRLTSRSQYPDNFLLLYFRVLFEQPQVRF